MDTEDISEHDESTDHADGVQGSFVCRQHIAGESRGQQRRTKVPTYLQDYY